jgi:hypothetical protein
MLPIQVDAVLAPLPPTLPIWTLVTGLAFLFGGVLLQFVDRRRLLDGNRRARLIVVVSISGGFLLAGISLLRTSFGAYALFLFLVFSLIQGAAAVHFYQRVVAFVQTGSLDQHLSGNRLTYALAKMFVLLIGLMVLLDVLSVIGGGFWRRAQLAYTVVVGGTSALGARYRLRAVEGDVHQLVIYGLILCIAGAELFDYSLTGELLVSMAGSVAFSVGFWICATAWIGTGLR